MSEIDMASQASDNEIIETYFQWLCEISGINSNNNYFMLAKTLHKKEYFWSVPNDDNRGSDGKKLRLKFAEETLYRSYDALEGPCTMLEMLVGISLRCEDMMYNMDTSDRTSKWFCMLLDNVGLTKFTDECFYQLNGCYEVNEILDIILERRYKRNGKGGLFPLKNTKKDLRKIELWYQMSEYLLENFYVNNQIV